VTAPLVIAFDYDATLTHTGRLSPEVIRALEQARAAGFALVLVTGRQLWDLERVCPEARRLFDRIVAENGAVLIRGEGSSQRLAERVDPRLAQALDARGLVVAEGEVMVATEARRASIVEEEVARLGLDVRLVRNRASLMVLPASVSKASGLSHAAASLGVELAQAVAVGDAENDREMLEVAGLGVAVANAVDELKAVADRVLDLPDGEGVVALLGELVALRAG
jgi:hydroxymethylpyrimidine pyrophosphatase-like HAD family hydrolase